MQHLALVALAALVAPGFAQQAASAAGPHPARPRTQPAFQVVDRALTFANPSFSPIANVGTHAQEILTSHAGWQYLSYWDEHRNLTLARRPLPSRDWEILRFTDYQIPGEDSHNQAVVGIAPGDGTIHLSFDHHRDDLNYRVSVPGLASDPAAFAWDVSNFGPVVDVLDPAEGPLTEVTYPTFVETPEGGLLFTYRQYTSGNGRERIVDYDATTSTWSNDRVFLERTGSYFDPLGGASTARNPYVNRIDFDTEGTLHLTWTWRENATIRYNRDINYAYSTDRGITWTNAAGVIVADTSIGGSIDLNTPGVRGVELGAAWGLLNNQGHIVDGRGRVHTVMYRKDVPDTTVSYGNGFNSHYVHDWHDADGSWRSFQLSTIGDRPKLVADAHGNLVLVYRSGASLALDVATPEANYEDWTRRYLLPGNFRSSTQVDFNLMEDYGVLSVVLQRAPRENGLPSQIGVVDIVLDPPVVEPPDATLEAVADTYGRGGVHADTNFGSSDKLVLKDDPNVDFDREAFLRFDLASLAAGRAIASARLVLTGAGRSDLARTTPYLVHAVADDTWQEATLTWNNRPALGASPAAHFARDDMQWDVTDLVVGELAGDGVLSLGLSTGLVGGQRALNLWSREAADPARRPRLELFFVD